MKDPDSETDAPLPESDDRAAADVDERIATMTGAADLEPVADALAADRDAVLGRWLAAARRQPFHHDRPERAVSDDVPALFDAVVAVLRRGDAVDKGRTAPLDDEAVVEAATAHAQARFEQGLGPIAVVTEFRLLRQEINRAMYDRVDDDTPVRDVIAGVAIVGDALDGSATVGLSAMSDRIETVRESFLATTLHDVRQPITLVEGSLHLAERWLAASEPDRVRLSEAVHDALVATSELATMIDTLSDASRVAMGALEADPEPASLEHVVREAIDGLGPEARARVTVTVAPGGHLIGLWDPHLLRRVVANLVGNALKYSSADLGVEVDVAPGDETTARFEVRDHGIGMADDELEQVFERFVRTERARRSGAPGLGLGLYACRGIVAANGGTIRVESEGYDRGTRVIVTLPTIDETTIES